MKKMERGDFLLLLATVFVAVILFLWTWSANWIRRISPKGNQLVAKVERAGKTIAEIDLNSIADTQYIRFDEGIKLTIEVKAGRIRFLDSECPDQICVNTVWLTRKGDVAVCLPAKTVVSI